MIALLSLAAFAATNHGPPADTTVIRGTVVEATTYQADAGLHTTYVVHVDETLRGQAADEVVLTLPGGVHDGLRMTVRGVPLFAVGDDAVVSLRAGPPAPLHGHFRVDGELLLPRHDGWPPTLAELEEALRTPDPRGLRPRH